LQNTAYLLPLGLPRIYRCSYACGLSILIALGFLPRIGNPEYRGFSFPYQFITLVLLGLLSITGRTSHSHWVSSPDPISLRDVIVLEPSRVFPAAKAASPRILLLFGPLIAEQTIWTSDFTCHCPLPDSWSNSSSYLLDQAPARIAWTNDLSYYWSFINYLDQYLLRSSPPVRPFCC
jgi:hypothetical protein